MPAISVSALPMCRSTTVTRAPAPTRITVCGKTAAGAPGRDIHIELQRRRGADAGRHLDVRAAILERGRERGEAVGFRRHDLQVRRSGGVASIGQGRQTHARVGRAFERFEVGAAGVHDAAGVVDRQRRNVAVLAARAGHARQSGHARAPAGPLEAGEIEFGVVVAPARRERRPLALRVQERPQRALAHARFDRAAAARPELAQLIDRRREHCAGGRKFERFGDRAGHHGHLPLDADVGLHLRLVTARVGADERHVERPMVEACEPRHARRGGEHAVRRLGHR